MLTERNLQDYFVYLATCNYSKAKRIMDNFPMHNKTESRSGLSKLLQAFMAVLNLEKKYYSMEFLINRRKSLFSKKENNSEGYGDLLRRIDAIKMDDVNNNDCSDITRMAKSSICQICEIRSRMTEMYIEISQLVRNDYRAIIDIVDFVRPIKEFIREIMAKSNEPDISFTTPLLVVIELEIDVLLCLAEAHQLISNLYFLVPINLLHSSNDKCQLLLQKCSYVTPNSRIFSRNSHCLPLLSWLNDFYNLSLAKYTLYFYPILMQRMSILPPDCAASYEGRAMEFVQRIMTFVKRASASSFLLIFDATKQNHPFLGHGYVLPSCSGGRLVGLQSYPVIFSCPMEWELSQQLHCSIVMLIGRMVNSEDSEDNIEYLAEPDGSRTYFLARIDFRVYLVLVFEERREREKIIVNFIENIKCDLNGKSVMDQLTSISG